MPSFASWLWQRQSDDPKIQELQKFSLENAGTWTDLPERSKEYIAFIDANFKDEQKKT